MNDTFPVKAQICETSLQNEIIKDQTCGYNESTPSCGMDQAQFSDNESAMRYRHFALNNDVRLQIPARKTYDHIQDKELRKKLKNRESAQAARDRKKAKMVFLEGKVSELVERNRYLEDENENLRKWLHKMDASYNCWGSKRPETNHQNTYGMPYTEAVTDSMEHFVPRERILPTNFPIESTYYNVNHGGAISSMPLRNSTIDESQPSSTKYPAECITRQISDSGRVFPVSEIRENIHLNSEVMLSPCNRLSHLPDQRIGLSKTGGDGVPEQNWLMPSFKSQVHENGVDNERQKMPCVSSDFDCVSSFFDENSIKEESDYTWETHSSVMSGSSPEYGRNDRGHVPYQVPENTLTLSPQDMSNESTISSPCSSSDISHGLDEGFMLEVH